MELSIGGKKPSSELWLKEAKSSANAGRVGMYLIHNGVVRGTAKKEIYSPGSESRPVLGMRFSADESKVREGIQNALGMPGIYYIRVWLADGDLSVGDDIMQVLIGADSRPDCVACLTSLVGFIKNECVTEKEIF